MMKMKVSIKGLHHYVGRKVKFTDAYGEKVKGSLSTVEYFPPTRQSDYESSYLIEGFYVVIVDNLNYVILDDSTMVKIYV